MKKFLCLVLALVLAMSIFAGCGKSKTNDETPTPTEQSEPPKNTGSEKTEYDLPEPSTNKEVVTEEEAPDVYLVMNTEDNAASISYHLKDCKLLKTGDSQKVAWEMVKTLGFHQCPECNPPRYEDYNE